MSKVGAIEFLGYMEGTRSIATCRKNRFAVCHRTALDEWVSKNSSQTCLYMFVYVYRILMRQLFLKEGDAGFVT